MRAIGRFFRVENPGGVFYAKEMTFARLESCWNFRAAHGLNTNSKH